jgi:hypothetical protein
MGAMTKLMAVNRMLRGAGESPVSTLIDDGVNDVSMAVAILDETNQMLQIDRQSFNTEDTTLSPDNDGNIYINADTLFVDTRGDHANISIAVRGSPPRLYNLDDNTYEWDEDLQVKITILVPFDDVPTATQYEICDMAARVYQMQTMGDPTQDAILSQISMRSQIRSRANEMRQSDYSMLRKSKIARYISNSRYRYWFE